MKYLLYVVLFWALAFTFAPTLSVASSEKSSNSKQERAQDGNEQFEGNNEEEMKKSASNPKSDSLNAQQQQQVLSDLEKFAREHLVNIAGLTPEQAENYISGKDKTSGDQTREDL